MKFELITENENQTINFAEKLAKVIKLPSVVALVGELGSGKTTFTKGFAKGLGIKNVVTSPTFTILNEYKDGKINMYHFDMYRLCGEDEARAVGFESYFDLNSLDGISIVEWAENAKGILPNSYIEIVFEKIDDDKRKITYNEIFKEKK